MAKLTLPGLIIIIVVFFILTGFIASKITVDGSAVNMPGGTSTSLLNAMWHGLTGAIGCTNPTINNPAGINP